MVLLLTAGYLGMVCCQLLHLLPQLNNLPTSRQPAVLAMKQRHGRR